MSKMMLWLLIICCLSACAAEVPQAPQAKVYDQEQLQGAGRDAYGCVISAGYSWCLRTQKCERPWDLAAAIGFAKSQEAFQKYCNVDQ